MENMKKVLSKAKVAKGARGGKDLNNKTKQVSKAADKAC